MNSSDTAFDSFPNFDGLAEKLNISRSTLYRQLQEQNISYKEIVEQERKSKALRYIKETSLSMGEISDMLGYANLSAFNRAFKRWFDVTPTLYRK